MTSLKKKLQKNSSDTSLLLELNEESNNRRDNSDYHDSEQNINSLSNSINFTSSPSSTGSQIYCRICLMPIEPRHIKNYCLCRGTTGVYHKSCQLKWLIISNKEHCEVCNYHFNFKKEYGINYKFICSISFTLGIIGLFIGHV